MKTARLSANKSVRLGNGARQVDVTARRRSVAWRGRKRSKTAKTHNTDQHARHERHGVFLCISTTHEHNIQSVDWSVDWL